jgi:ribosomal protein S18 acetylase RimI-like enzyme
VQIRPLAWGDFDGWADLYYTRYDEIRTNPDLGIFTFETPPTRAEEAQHFGNVMRDILAGDALLLVAEESGRIVGECSVRRLAKHVEDRHLGGLGIAVHPEWRSRGIGDALLGRMLELCRGRFESIDLQVLAVNETARKLYRKHGFREIGTHPRGVKRAGRYYEDVLMWRPVDPAPSDGSEPSGP